MRFIGIILCGLLALGCNKQHNDVPVDLGFNYFPTQVGATWIYHVDSLVYDDNAGFTTIDTFVYQYKEQIVGNFLDVSGQTGQLVNRFFRNADTLDWQQVNSSSILKTELNVQKVIENRRFVKLVFPLANGKKWNGNMYNSLGEQEFTVNSFDQPSTIGLTQFPLTLTVLQKEDINAIEEMKQYEIYARNVGLVYALFDSINTQVGGSRGFRYRITLTSFTP